MHALTLPDWAYTHEPPTATGDIKIEPADFNVAEMLAFSPEGNGEHVFLHIQKTGENTDYIARLLARFAGVRQRDIGVAGMKDRHAITTQWFSVWLPGKADPDWAGVESDTLKILHAIRHPRKLKRGSLLGNQFKLLIRNFSGDVEKTNARLERVKAQGFPNYYGQQRFGQNGQNINAALALFDGAKMKPQQRSIYLSAARSYLFNAILSERVRLQNWQLAIAGDVLMINQSNSYFSSESLDDSLKQRVVGGELHPTGCLYGTGTNRATQEALAIEEHIFASQPALTQGLVKFGLEMDRRTLRCYSENLHWQFLDNQQLQLDFFLRAGSYATALLREIITID